MVKFNGKDILFSPKINISENGTAYDEGFADGKKTEYDRFWDAYQLNGKRTNYKEAFHLEGWTDQSFNPKYDMQPTACDYMFYQSKITDLKQKLIDCGVTLDFSNATNLYYFAMGSTITHLPEIGGAKTKRIDHAFNGCSSLASVDKVIISDDGSCNVGNSFDGCSKLKDITFAGTIGKSINFQWSPLSADSIRSIVEALSETATGQTLTLKKSAVDTAFEDGDGLGNGSESSEWGDLISSKENWTISLV